MKTWQLSDTESPWVSFLMGVVESVLNMNFKEPIVMNEKYQVAPGFTRIVAESHINMNIL